MLIGDQIAWQTVERQAKLGQGGKAHAANLTRAEERKMSLRHPDQSRHFFRRDVSGSEDFFEGNANWHLKNLFQLGLLLCRTAQDVGDDLEG